MTANQPRFSSVEIFSCSSSVQDGQDTVSKNIKQVLEPHLPIVKKR